MAPKTPASARRSGRPSKRPKTVQEALDDTNANSPPVTETMDTILLGQTGRESLEPVVNSEDPSPNVTSADNSGLLPAEEVQARLSKPKRGRPRRQNGSTSAGASPALQPDVAGALDVEGSSAQSAQESHRTLNSGQLLIVTNRGRGRPRKYIDTGPLHEFVIAPYVEEKVDLADSFDALEDGQLDVRAALTELSTKEDYGLILDAVKSIVLEKVCQRKSLAPVALDEQSIKLRQPLEQTINAGEGNSIFVIGAKGSGKTALLNSILSDLSVQHQSEFHVIRLNGFIHTDDKLALREIWRQLGRELDPEDDEQNNNNGQAVNYADALTSLLALLSHPSELSNGDDAARTAKAVVFVIDELDLFANHPRQTLLYNLFDIAQARKAPIAVVGLTSRINAVETLEKRVKSRFSHRYVHIAAPDYATYWEICRSALVVTEQETKALTSENPLSSPKGLKFIELWAAMIDDLQRRSASFKSHIERHFTSGTVSSFLSDAILPISMLGRQDMPLKGTAFLTQTVDAPDSKLSMLDGLSDLSLALLIAGARLNLHYEVDTCNFNMAYAEYVRLASNMKTYASVSGAMATGLGSRIWSKDAAAKAWEALAHVNLIIPAVSTMGGVSMSGKSQMYRFDVALEEIRNVVAWTYLGKWCRDM